MLALLAQATVLVVPFAVKDAGPAAAGVAVSETITDVVVQANRDNFITLKQLDAVLRRRDLKLEDAALPERALELAKALGATDVIVGEVSKAGIDARRLLVANGVTKAQTRAEGPLPQAAQAVANDLLKPESLPPLMTANTKALELAAHCEANLARQSLGAHSKMTLPKDQLAEAEKACKTASQLDPKFALPHAGLAVTMIVRGKFAEARKEAQKASDLRITPLASLAESFAARKMKDFERWRVILESAVAERPGFLHALGYLAEDKMEAGEDKASLELFDRYLQRAPNHSWAMGKKAREMAKLGQFDEAIDLSEKALQMNPTDPELLIETASRYIDAGRDPRAEPLLRKAMEATPPRPLAALRLGYLYFRTHKLGQAKEALEQCIQMATRVDEARTRGIAHADLARVAAKQNRYPDAVGELQKARSEGNNHLPCEEPELARWKDRPELKQVCVEAAAAATDEKTDDDVAVEL